MKRSYKPLRWSLLLMLLFGLFTTASLQAQSTDGDGDNAFFNFEDEEEEPRKTKISGGLGYFIPGYVLKEHTMLNDYLRSDIFEDNGITIGGGGQIVVRNFVIGGEGHGTLTQEGTFGTQTAKLRSGWGTFNLGYVVWSKRGFMLYPRVGVGGYNNRLTLMSNTGPNTVDQTVIGIYPGTELVQKGVLLSGDIGFSWMPGFDETSGAGLVLGLNIGYNYAATSGDWYAYDNVLTGGPVVDPSGVFVRLTIGGGGWHRQ